MIPYSRSIFAISASSLDETPSGMGTALAQDYLNGWTCLWDPRLLQAIACVPEWKRADASGLDVEDALIVCPESSRDRLDTPLEERIRAGNCCLVHTAQRPRTAIVIELLEHLRARWSEVENETTAARARSEFVCQRSDTDCCRIGDFYAFGYLVLQVQAMARKLRYSVNLDWMILGDQIMNAAKASVDGDDAETDRWLVAAFDAVSQERDRYCSQQGHLIELILTGASTLGAQLTKQLSVDRPLTLYATTNNLKRLRDTNSNAWVCLKERVENGSVALAGGLRSERKHAWMTELSLIREMSQAQADFHELGLPAATSWMRFEPSILAHSPTLARQFGFIGGIIADIGGGSVPSKEHAKVKWQPSGETSGLDCILGHVVDAANAESILGLGAQMAKQLDYHQVPTLILAHWPGSKCDAFDDLVAAMVRSPAIGKWIDTRRYFATTAQPYWTDHYGSHEFRTRLPQSVSELNELHARIIETTAQSHRLERLDSLRRLWRFVPYRSGTASQAIDMDAWHRSLLALQLQCDERWSKSTPGTLSDPLESSRDAIDSAIDALTNDLTQDMRLRVPGENEDVVFNACGHAQRILLADMPHAWDPESSTRIVAQATERGQPMAVIDVPPFGFAKFQGLANLSAAASSRQPGDLASAESSAAVRSTWWSHVFGGRNAIAQSDGSLANEFMEIQIDPDTGHLRSMYVVNKRGNRLSCRLGLISNALDLKQPLNDALFTGLTDVRMRVLHASKVRGTIEVTGKLATQAQAFQDQGGVMDSEWTLRYTLWHGVRWMDVECVGRGIDAHRCYPVWRMVWPSEAASIAAWQNGTRGKLPAPLQAAVELIEIDDVEHKIHFATRGLSMHRRMGHNGLVSVLPVQSTGVCSAHFSIGMDWPRPWETAIDRLLPPLVAYSKNERPLASNRAPDAGAWLARCNVPNLRFTWIDPSPPIQVSETFGDEHDCDGTEGPGIDADACVWVVETKGKSGAARLGCIRPIQRAWRVDFRGLECDKLKVEDGEVVIPFKGWERSRIALCFGP